MPVYNVIEYSSNYSETTGRLRFYCKDEATNFNAELLIIYCCSNFISKRQLKTNKNFLAKYLKDQFI